jgi:hypothetical protein
MPFNVRIFAHRSLEQMVHKDRQYTSDTVFVLTQPYEWAQRLTAGGVAVDSLRIVDDNPQAGVNILRIEVPPGEAIRYEINPPGRAVAASIDSPILSGNDQFYFRSGYSISVIDASTVAA